MQHINIANVSVGMIKMRCSLLRVLSPKRKPAEILTKNCASELRN